MHGNAHRYNILNNHIPFQKYVITFSVALKQSFGTRCRACFFLFPGKCSLALYSLACVQMIHFHQKPKLLV